MFGMQSHDLHANTASSFFEVVGAGVTGWLCPIENPDPWVRVIELCRLGI